MEIRSYREADEPEVAALWKAVFGYGEPRHHPRESIRRKLAFQRDLFFVAVEADAVVGTVMGGYDGHRGWVYSLAVDPAHRRRGIATALMRHVEAALATLDAPKINLQIFSHNHGVVAFYESIGYRVEERISMGKVTAEL